MIFGKAKRKKSFAPKQIIKKLNETLISEILIEKTIEIIDDANADFLNPGSTLRVSATRKSKSKNTPIVKLFSVYLQVA